LEECAALAGSLGQSSIRFTQKYWHAGRALLAGDLDMAESLAEEAFQIATSSEQVEAATFYAVPFLCASWQRGTIGSMVPLLQQVADGLSEIPTFKAVLAVGNLQAGNVAEAGALLEAFGQDGFFLPKDSAWMPGILAYSEVAIALETQSSCAEIFDQLLPFSDQISYNGMSTEGPVCLYLGGLAAALGRFAEADEFFRQSSAQCNKIGAKSFAARTKLWWGRMLLRSGKPSDVSRAYEMLSMAKEESSSNGYGATDREATDLLSELEHSPDLVS
jgi:hypothetical protein